MEPGVSTPQGRSSVSVPLNGRVPSVTKVHNPNTNFFNSSTVGEKNDHDRNNLFIYEKYGFAYFADKNECLNPNACLNGGTCININGGYQCKCPPGFTGEYCTMGKVHMLKYSLQCSCFYQKYNFDILKKKPQFIVLIVISFLIS